MSSPYLDPSLPVEERVERILALMTRDQRLSCLAGIPQMTLSDGTVLPSIGNDGIEAVHGAGLESDATLFPQPIGLGSTWNPELVRRIGEAIGKEARSRNPLAIRAFGPVADIRSNPLSGRFEEGFGEDPFHVGTMVTAMAHGLRGDDPVYVRLFPVIKHFVAYNHEWHRARSSSSMSVRALHEYQLVPYRMPVRSGAAAGAMTAYNLVNGIPSIIHPLTDVLRTDDSTRRFKFFPDAHDVGSLAGSKGAPFDTWEVPMERDVSYVEGLQPSASSALSADRDSDDGERLAYAAALMLKAGITCFADGSELPICEAAEAAVDAGLFGVGMDEVDEVVRAWLTFLVRSGRLDPDICPYETSAPGSASVRTAEHRELALSSAREQLVLLKNDGLLPLDAPSIGKLAIFGPLADENLRDYYSPLVEDQHRSTPLDGIVERLKPGRVTYHTGSDVVAWSADGRYVSMDTTGWVTASTEHVGVWERFEVYDWGYGQYYFRNPAAGRFLQADYRTDGIHLAGLHERMEDGAKWFTNQNFHYRREGTQGTLFRINHVLGDISMEDAEYVRIGDNGGMTLARGGPALAFTEERLEDGPVAAARVAAEADAAVVVIGNHPLVHAREAHDRPGLDLGRRQIDLVNAVAAAKPGKTIVVVMSSYPFAVGEIASNPDVAAVLYSTHAGECSGTALADALFGDYSPAGRLSTRWLANTSSLPQAGPYREELRVNDVDMLEYDVIGAGLTYRFSEADAVYPFGHGLTYTSFDYRELEVPQTASGAEGFGVSLVVTNVGPRISDEVVQVYARSLNSAYGDAVPRMQLVGFDRVHRLGPGESRRVEISVDPDALSVWDVARRQLIVESGRYEIRVGASSVDIRLSATVHVDGYRIEPLDLRDLPRNVWEHATHTHGVTFWEASQARTLARNGKYHSVLSRRGDDFVGFTNAVLDGVKGIELALATSTAEWTDHGDLVVEVRAGDSDGPLLGTVPVPRTEGIQEFAVAAAKLTTDGGISDLYLVFSGGGICLDSIRLLSSIDQSELSASRFAD